MEEEARLTVLHAAHLLDSPPEENFDRLTRLAALLLHVPIALVSLVDDRRQFFKSAVGLTGPLSSKRETPLSHSFCKMAVDARAPLIVDDARRDPRVRDNPAIRDHDVIAYAGVPLLIDDQAIGAFCVIDAKPRTWTDNERIVLEAIAHAVESEIALRTALRQAHDAEVLRQRSEQIHRAVVRHVPNGGIFVVDRDFRYVMAEGNALANILQRTGWTTIIGRGVTEIAAPENIAETHAIFSRALNGESHRTEIVREGRVLDLNAVPIYDEASNVSHALVFLYDVTDRKHEAEEIRQTRDLLNAIIANMHDGVVLLDANRNVLVANAALHRTFGFAPETMYGMTRAKFLERLMTLTDAPESFMQRMHEGSANGDYAFTRPRPCILRRSESALELPSGVGYLVTWQDVTMDRSVLADRERELMIDALTRIANRRAAEAAISTSDVRRKTTGIPLSVAMFDIDHFKRVNDVHGHQTGDDVLKRAAATLASQARTTDVVARWGGEEFIAVLIGPLDGAVVFCERARLAIERMQIPVVDHITVSCGVAELGPEETPASAIARADERLYEAKHQGRNRTIS